MKLYSVWVSEWDADDWYAWYELNESIDPTNGWLAGTFLTEEEATEFAENYDADTEFHTETTVYESDDLDESELDPYIEEYGSIENIPNERVWVNTHLTGDNLFADIYGEDRLLDRDIVNFDFEIGSASNEISPLTVIVAWSWNRYVGYAHKFEGLYYAEDLGFDTEYDLTTGNSESTFRTNYSIVLTGDEVEGLTDAELYDSLEDELYNGSWKWTYDSHVRRAIEDFTGYDPDSDDEESYEEDEDEY